MQIRIGRGKQPALHPYLAVCGLFKKVHTTEQRAFPASGRSDHNDLLSLFYVAGYSLQHLQLTEVFIYVVYIYYYFTLHDFSPRD